jgi:chemotaxis protein methyltransferase CheR
MTINVSELFRNPERFDELEKRFMPDLLEASKGRGLRVWSAGCSYGAEPYTLAILLKEAGPRLVHELVATDIDETILARAREGYFTDADLQHVTAARRERWFDRQPDGRMRVKAELRAMVRFSRLDLLKDPYPRSRDLILCRNVVIYFNEDAKERIYERFFQALQPGGTLFVGSTERVCAAARLGWERPSTFFSRRPAAGCVRRRASRRARSSSATDHAWNGQPVAPCGGSPSAVSDTDPSPQSPRCASRPSSTPSTGSPVRIDAST